MRIGRHDIKHLAIIGVAGVAGLMATVAVFEAAEGPHVQHYRGSTWEGVRAEPVPGQPGRVRVELRRQAGGDEHQSQVEAASVVEDASPIVYVDGVRFGSVDDLSPEDIYSIDVFKGPEAVERYGEEAADGVIAVTTKEGRKKEG